jgi:hypothetical protein
VVGAATKEHALPDQQAIDKELERLTQLRRELAHYLTQQASLGRDMMPFEVTDGIRRTREQIQQTKALLQSWNVPVND